MKRYKMRATLKGKYEIANAESFPHKDGAWVLWEDHKARVADLEAERDEIELDVAFWKGKAGESGTERDEARLDRDNEAAAREGWYAEVERLQAAIEEMANEVESSGPPCQCYNPEVHAPCWKCSLVIWLRALTDEREK